MILRTPVLHALWLAEHVALIANTEQAGDCYRDIHNAVDAIERLINRPFPPRILGPCPQLVENRAQCGIRLTADRHATEVMCPRCKTVHDVERLIAQQTDEVEEMSFTLTEMRKVVLPVQGLYIPARTLQWWAASGRMMPTGHDQFDRPKFKLRDVRELWDARPQRGLTGAATHRSRRAS